MQISQKHQVTLWARNAGHVSGMRKARSNPLYLGDFPFNDQLMLEDSLSDSAHGWVEVVYGEVVRIHVDDDVLTPEGKMDIPRIRPLARLGYYDYTSVTDVFEMRIPDASGHAADGLEGKAPY